MTPHARSLSLLISLGLSLACPAARSEINRSWNEYYKAAESMMLHRHYDKAEPLLKIAIVKAREAGEPTGVDSSLDELAELYRLEKDFPQAARVLEMLIKERIDLWWPDHPYVLQARRRLADLYLYNHQGTPDELIETLKQVVADDEHIFGPEDRQTGQDLDTLAYSLLTYSGKPKEAQAIYERVLRIREKTLPKTNETRVENFSLKRKLRKQKLCSKRFSHFVSRNTAWRMRY